MSSSKDRILNKLYSIHRRRIEDSVPPLVEEKIRCPVCGSDRVIRSSTGSLVCSVCGTVIEDRPIDMGPEWRAFTPEEVAERARAGPAVRATSIASSMLTTAIEVPKSDVKTSQLLKKLERLQKRVFIYTSKERAIISALAEAERIATMLGLPKSLVDDALKLFEKAYEENLLAGRNVKVVVSACLYLACRLRGIARTLDEFVQASGEAWSSVAEVCRLLVRRLNIRLPLSDPKLFVDRICQQLGLSGKVIIDAKKIIDEAKKNRITAGKDPAGLAAAAVYIACLLNGEVRTQKEIARAAGVTEVTIRNRYRELVNRLGIQLPQGRGQQ